MVVYPICVPSSYIGSDVYLHPELPRSGCRGNSSLAIMIGFPSRSLRLVEPEESKLSVEDSYPELQGAVAMEESQMSIGRFPSGL